MTGIEGKLILDLVENEVPSGTPNGVLTTFTITHQPTEPGAVRITQNGLSPSNGVDFTMGGTLNKTITFAVAPATATKLYATYTRETGE